MHCRLSFNIFFFYGPILLTSVWWWWWRRRQRHSYCSYKEAKYAESYELLALFIFFNNNKIFYTKKKSSVLTCSWLNTVLLSWCVTRAPRSYRKRKKKKRERVEPLPTGLHPPTHSLTLSLSLSSVSSRHNQAVDKWWPMSKPTPPFFITLSFSVLPSLPSAALPDSAPTSPLLYNLYTRNDFIWCNIFNQFSL